jgi:hypothetical protein
MRILAKYNDVLEKLKIEKKIVSNIYEIKERYIIVTELGIYSVKLDLQIEWIHHFHYDMIWENKIKDDIIEIKEFDGTTYTLELKTGAQIT